MRFRKKRIVVLSFAFIFSVTSLLLIKKTAEFESIHYGDVMPQLVEFDNQVFDKDDENMDEIRLDDYDQVNDIDMNYSTDPYSLPGYQFHHEAGSVWSITERPWDDRIMKQLMYVPKGMVNWSPEARALKKIVVIAGTGDPVGQEYFIKNACPVDTCTLSGDPEEADTADAVVVGKDMYDGDKKPGQIWIMFQLEPPTNTDDMGFFTNKINWTATYRHDSTLVAPYEKYISTETDWMPPIKSYAEGKSKIAAMFVSNCRTSNSRLEYASELGKYVNVDVYGVCGKRTCSRDKDKLCFGMLRRKYKFYLAFENSNCAYYLTEKFFRNSLGSVFLFIIRM